MKKTKRIKIIKMGKDQRAQEDWSPRRTKNNETELIFKMTI